MSAIEMFNKLGYKREEDANWIVYTRYRGLTCSQIHFPKHWEEFEVSFTSFTIEEHQAIHQQMKELGWLD